MRSRILLLNLSLVPVIAALAISLTKPETVLGLDPDLMFWVLLGVGVVAYVMVRPHLRQASRRIEDNES